MKMLLVNTVFSFASTARIVWDIAREYEQKGHEVKIAYGRRMKSKTIPANCVHIGNDMDIYWHVFYSRFTDKHGLASKASTIKFLKWANEYDPDIIWIHNVHGYYINYELLFQWIKSRPQMQVKWTLHDCWAFTGHCAYYSYVNCDRWLDGCHSCPQKEAYPKALVDNCDENYRRKKEAFTGVCNMTLVTPSKWLADEVKRSFLKEYPIEVRYNKINKEIFKPISSTFINDYGLTDKVIILGVANIWEKRKGLDDFIELSRMLKEYDSKTGSGKNHQIVLVGLSEKQIKCLRKENNDIMALPRTSSAEELAKIYSAADVFVNMTHEDNYPTVNLEAEACGTPVISYDTGGCRETISRSDSCADCKNVIEVYNKLLQYEKDRVRG